MKELGPGSGQVKLCVHMFLCMMYLITKYEHIVMNEAFFMDYMNQSVYSISHKSDKPFENPKRHFRQTPTDGLLLLIFIKFRKIILKLVGIL